MLMRSNTVCQKQLQNKTWAIMSNGIIKFLNFPIHKWLQLFSIQVIEVEKNWSIDVFNFVRPNHMLSNLPCFLGFSLILSHIRTSSLFFITLQWAFLSNVAWTFSWSLTRQSNTLCRFSSRYTSWITLAGILLDLSQSATVIDTLKSSNE